MHVRVAALAMMTQETCARASQSKSQCEWAHDITCLPKKFWNLIAAGGSFLQERDL